MVKAKRRTPTKRKTKVKKKKGVAKKSTLFTAAQRKKLKNGMNKIAKNIAAAGKAYNDLLSTLNKL